MLTDMFLDQFSLGEIFEVESSRSLTAGEMRAAIQRRAVDFRNLGLDEGTGAVVFRNNTIEFFVDLLAAWSLGAWVAPLDKQLPQLVKEDLERTLRPRVVIDAEGRLRENKDSVRLEGASLILTTSGSSGRPKTIVHGFAGVKAKVDALSRAIEPAQTTRTLCALPTFFGHGLMCNSLFPLLTGQRLYLSSFFNPTLAASLAELIEEHRITFFSTTPIAWKLIEQFGAENARLPSLKRVHCASAPLTASHFGVMRSWAPEAEFWNVYGLTEFLGWVSGALLRDANDAGKIGRRGWDVEMREQDGELLLRGPSQAPAIEGWFATRDQVRLAADGAFVLLGRKDFMINKAGLKIQPEEVEGRALDSGLIRDACCFAIPDPLQGEKIGLAVVSGPDLKIDDLKRWLEARLPAFQVPDRIWETDEFPRTNRGKLDRRALRAKLEGQ